MSRANIAVGFGESLRSLLTSTRMLGSAHSCAERVQLSFEGLGSASNLLLLAEVGAGVVASCLSGLITDRGLGGFRISGRSVPGGET